MLGHTRKHHIKNEEKIINEEEKSISSEDYFKKVYGDFPMWAICIAGLRHREDLTQKQFAERIGVKQYNVSQMENGKRPIGKTIAKRIAKEFGCDYRIYL